MKTRQTLKIITLTWLGLCLIWAAGAAQTPDFLTGKVITLDTGGNLNARMQAAAKAFQRDGQGDYFMTGYSFQSRLQLDYRSREDGPFGISIRKDRIRVNFGRGEHSETTSTDRRNEPVGILFLHKGNGDIINSRLIDLDNTYTIDDTPLYWLGRGETADSLNTCEAIFTRGRDEVKKTMLFVIASHEGPRPLGFLEGVATGSHTTKIRREAIFWIGNNKDPESLGILKKIYQREADEKVREHIVFALYLGEDDSAVREIIRIAKSDDSTKVRKQAVFWLGQKATRESIGALKDVIKGDEDTELKKQALFALTQTKNKEAEDMLFDIARNHKNPQLRKTAMFWLGEINSDRALELYEQILLKK
jgi:hypothetical protein